MEGGRNVNKGIYSENRLKNQPYIERKLITKHPQVVLMYVYLNHYLQGKGINGDKLIEFFFPNFYSPNLKQQKELNVFI